jgi:AcrR family transcriptional regulator
MITVTAATLRQHGYQATSVARIARYAGVSSATFYEHFDDRDDCILHALEQCLREIAGLAETRVQTEQWSQKLTGAFRALLEFLEDRCGTEALEAARARGAEAVVIEHRERALQLLGSVIRAGRTKCPPIC